ncbi:hypothetical protein GSbR_12370 [Geobacter sp. SVR]|nr:hypothetical protein GSVR_15590 [Geobacter sp. SVR]GCF84637.1 hypothetical protein GSbR_12370 [Geobacter sp. SVR]
MDMSSKYHTFQKTMKGLGSANQKHPGVKKGQAALRGSGLSFCAAVTFETCPQITVFRYRAAICRMSFQL